MIHGVPLLNNFLTLSAQRSAEKIALETEAGEISYLQLNQQADRLAAFLREIGTKRGDRVLVFTENSIEAVVAFWGVLKSDAVISIINPQTKADKLGYLINNSGADVLIADEHLKPVVLAAMADTHSLSALIITGECDPFSLHSALPVHYQTGLRLASFQEAMHCQRPLPRSCNIDLDLAAIIYTSGSTGHPKGVMLTHRNMITAATSVSTYLNLDENDVILNVLPLAFDYGLYQMIMSVKVGAKLVLERSFTFPGAVLGKVSAKGVTVFPGVPTIFSVMAGMRQLKEFDLTKVRCVTNTAAALSESHIDFIRAVFSAAELYSMYGLTECKRCTYLPPKDIELKKMSVGIAIPNTELWLVDEEDRRLGFGQTGQLVIRGATVMKGYWNNPAETANKLRPGPLPGEQVLYTGDICRLDEDGYLYFVGRVDDIIKSRGEKVAPKEVENALYGLREVKDAAVIGVADPLWGQAVKAFVVLHKDTSLNKKTILAHCNQHLENFMVPKHLEIVDDLPKTAAGKIKKMDLK